MEKYLAPAAVRGAVALTIVLILKLLVLLQLRDHPLLQPAAGLDTTAYVDLAARVLAGDIGLGPGLYYVSPLYIYFIAGNLAVFDSFTALRIVQIVLGTASVACVYLTAKAWFGRRPAWIAGAVAALTGIFTFYEVVIIQSSIDAFMTSAALLALTLGLSGGQGVRQPEGQKARGRRGRSAGVGAELRSVRTGRWLLVAGIIFGLATLNRPNMPFGAAAVVGVLLLTRRFRPAALIVAGLLAGIAPAAIRNADVAGQWTFVPSHGGLNFYIGNGEGATGFYRQLPGISPTIGGQERDVKRVAQAAVGRPLTDAETSDYFYGLAWTWIRAHPLDAAALFARKVAYTFSGHHVALPHSYPFYAYDEQTLLRFYVFGPWLLVPLGIVGLGLVAPRSAGADYLAWAAFVPGYAVGVAAFFVAERYRLPLLVPLCVGTGALIDFAIRSIESNEARRLRVPAFAVAALLAFANWPRGLQDGRWEEGLRTAQRLVITHRYAEADDYVRRFEPRGPHPGAMHYGVGAQLLIENQPERALPHLTRANELGSERPEVAYALGQALLKTERARDAVAHLQRGFEAGIQLPLGGYELALALHTVGDNAGAVRIIQRIGLPHDEEDPEAWLRIGRLAARAKAPDVAQGYFQRAVQMRPDMASARQQYGLNLLVLRRYDEAALHLAEAVRLDPRDPDSLAHLAYCELQLGNTAAAIRHVEAALGVEPAHPLANQLLAAIRADAPHLSPPK